MVKIFRHRSACLLALAVLAATALAGCGSSRTTAGGSTGLATAGDVPQAGDLARCPRRLGTIALTEAEGNAQALSSAGLPRSMAPLVRHMVSRTHCFQVVDRGAAFALLEQERKLREQLGGDEAAQGRKLQVADYVLRAEIVFSEQTQSRKGVIGGMFGNVLGGLGAGTTRKEAVVLLSVVDARTSEIVSSVFGRGSSDTAGLGSVVLASGALAFEGGWDDTPQAKTVAAALVDAWNRSLPHLRDEVAAAQRNGGATEPAR